MGRNPRVRRSGRLSAGALDSPAPIWGSDDVTARDNRYAKVGLRGSTEEVGHIIRTHSIENLAADLGSEVGAELSN